MRHPFCAFEAFGLIFPAKPREGLTFAQSFVISFKYLFMESKKPAGSAKRLTFNTKSDIESTVAYQTVGKIM